MASLRFGISHAVRSMICSIDCLISHGNNRKNRIAGEATMRASSAAARLKARDTTVFIGTAGAGKVADDLKSHRRDRDCRTAGQCAAAKVRRGARKRASIPASDTLVSKPLYFGGRWCSTAMPTPWSQVVQSDASRDRSRPDDGGLAAALTALELFLMIVHFLGWPQTIRFCRLCGQRRPKCRRAR